MRKVINTTNCAFVRDGDDVYLVLPASQVATQCPIWIHCPIELNLKDSLVTVKVPLESLKTFVYAYLRDKIKSMSDDDLEKSIVEGELRQLYEDHQQ